MGINIQLSQNRNRFDSLIYSLKVWLSSVAISPLIYLILNACFSQMRGGFFEQLEIYPMFVLFEVIFSFVTWLIFWAIVEVTRILPSSFSRKLIIFIFSIILSMGTVLALFASEMRFSLSDMIFDFGIANCICIGAGCWFFRLGPKIERDQEIVTI